MKLILLFKFVLFGGRERRSEGEGEESGTRERSEGEEGCRREDNLCCWSSTHSNDSPSTFVLAGHMVTSEIVQNSCY